MENKKASNFFEAFLLVGGPDGTRTRDPMRDRHVF
jgi:hypothetical protein